jgi:hypothetical protein
MLKIRKKKIILAISIIGLFISFICFVFLDAYDMKEFRSMQDEIPSTQEVDLTGLREIRASGGYLPRFPTLAKKLSHVKEDKIIINAESELTEYVKGLPITLLGYRKSTPDWKYYVRRLVFTGTIKERPDLITSGDQEAKKYGFIYKNLVIGSKFSVPDKNIDDIVTFFDNFAQNSWIHFHCTHGKGRTSMLLAMLDIMKNAPKVALKDIIRRQRLLGSVDLADTVRWLTGGYTKEMLENRKKFIEDFYTFVCQRKAGGIQRWSEWHATSSLPKENF